MSSIHPSLLPSIPPSSLRGIPFISIDSTMQSAMNARYVRPGPGTLVTPCRPCSCPGLVRAAVLAPTAIRHPPASTLVSLYNVSPCRCMRAPQGAQATARPSVHMVQPARISVRCPRFAGICSFSCVYMWICGWFAGRAQSCREWAVPSGSAPVRRGLAACSPSRNLLSRLASRDSRLPSRYSRLTPGVCCVLQVIAQALSRAQSTLR